MTEDEIEYIKAWLHKANEDIQVILRLSENQPEIFTGAILLFIFKRSPRY